MYIHENAVVYSCYASAAAAEAGAGAMSASKWRGELSPTGQLIVTSDMESKSKRTAKHRFRISVVLVAAISSSTVITEKRLADDLRTFAVRQ